MHISKKNSLMVFGLLFASLSFAQTTSGNGTKIVVGSSLKRAPTELEKQKEEIKRRLDYQNRRNEAWADITNNPDKSIPLDQRSDRWKIATYCNQPPIAAWRPEHVEILKAEEWDLISDHSISKKYPFEFVNDLRVKLNIEKDGADDCDYYTIKFKDENFVSIDMTHCPDALKRHKRDPYCSDTLREMVSKSGK